MRHPLHDLGVTHHRIASLTWRRGNDHRGFNVRKTTRRISLAGIAAVTSAALLATVAPNAMAADSTRGEATAVAVAAESQAPALTPEQRQFIEDEMGPEALAEIQKAMSQNPSGGVQTRAFPIAAAAIGAAAWCAKGALASIPTSVLSDIAAGKASSKKTYVRNAVIGCLGGEIGGVVWKFLPGWVKNKAINMVIAFIIKYVR
ncbi:putative membrane protein [Streptomyces sp. TE5632]